MIDLEEWVIRNYRPIDKNQVAGNQITRWVRTHICCGFAGDWYITPTDKRIFLYYDSVEWVIYYTEIDRLSATDRLIIVAHGKKFIISETGVDIQIDYLTGSKDIIRK